MDAEKLKGLLGYLAHSLVKNQAAVEIEAQESDKTLILKLKVAQEDMGRIIGKGGKTAKAIRSLLRAASDRHGKRVVVEIVEEAKS